MAYKKPQIHVSLQLIHIHNPINMQCAKIDFNHWSLWVSVRGSRHIPTFSNARGEVVLVWLWLPLFRFLYFAAFIKVLVV